MIGNFHAEVDELKKGSSSGLALLSTVGYKEIERARNSKRSNLLLCIVKSKNI